MEVLRAKGPDVTVDIDQACLSETMDMIGLFGFRYDFNGLRHAHCLQDAAEVSASQVTACCNATHVHSRVTIEPVASR